MNAIVSLLKKEPLVILGAVAAGVLGTIQSLGGHGILSGSVVDWATNALDPNSGWLLPLVVTILGRFLVVSPATHQAAVDKAAAQTQAASVTPDL